MSIVTKTGDRGTTGLFGGGRVPKSSPRLHAYGTVDELNAAIGVALTCVDLPEVLKAQLTSVQHLLFRVGGDLATPFAVKEKQERVGDDHIRQIEEWIAALEASLPLQRQFILPGGSPVAAHLHLARTVCRRAERWVCALGEREVLNPCVQIFLNRLGDYLLVAAREANREMGVGDIEVRY